MDNELREGIAIVKLQDRGKFLRLFQPKACLYGYL